MDREILKCVKMRDAAFISAVMNDDFRPFMKYASRYSIPVPDSERILKGSVYKAAYNVVTLPPEVRKIAKRKCLDLGITPEFMT